MYARFKFQNFNFGIGQVEIFIESERLLRNVNEFNNTSSDYFHNVPYVLNKCKELLEYMKKERVNLRKECDAYLKSNRNEIYIRYWLEQGWNIFHPIQINSQPKMNLLHPDFYSEWERIYTQIGSKEEYLFKNAYELYMEKYKKSNISFCTEDSILQYHSGKKCISNGWYCDYCEDVEIKWHKYLTQCIESAQNIFLNKEVKEEFLVKAIQLPFTLVPNEWKPPSPQRIMLQFNADGKTPTQLMFFIVDFAKYQIKIWNFLEKEISPFTYFCEVWNFLETLDSKLSLLEHACEEVEKIISSH